jgi:thiamine kinase-like enzyme
MEKDSHHGDTPLRERRGSHIVSTVGTHGSTNNLVQYLDVDDAPNQNFSQFSEVSNPETIREICSRQVPGWDKYLENADLNSIKIHQLCEGLSNQIYKVYLENISPFDGVDCSTNNCQPLVSCVLFRVYGKEVSKLYDPQNEFQTYTTLAKYGIAPQCYGTGHGWRIEEWHQAIPVLNKIMTNPSILAQVAAQLGRFHKLNEKQRDFPRDISDCEPNVERRLREWSATAKELRFSGDNARRFKNLEVDDMTIQAEWLRKFLISENSNVKGNGLDKVMSHGDVQENNILQTQYGLRLIDFEYSGMCYQAFDIANYFVECTIDYLHKQFPYYSVDPTKYPTEYDQRLFCAIYLSEYLEWRVLPDSPEVDDLLRSVEKFTLASHLIWALWSIVRCPGGGTFCEFDFLLYGQTRWEMFKKAKHDLLAKRTNPDIIAQRPSEPTGPITTMSAGAGIATLSFCVALLALKVVKK